MKILSAIKTHYSKLFNSKPEFDNFKYVNSVLLVCAKILLRLKF